MPRKDKSLVICARDSLPLRKFDNRMQTKSHENRLRVVAKKMKETLQVVSQNTFCNKKGEAAKTLWKVVSKKQNEYEKFSKDPLKPP